MIVSSGPLHSSALHCRELVGRVSRDRALLAELAPANIRPHLWAIAAFDWEIGRIPDLVSEPMLGAIRRQWWREAWAEIASGNPRHHPVVETLAEAHRASPLPLGAVETYMDAREAEQEAPPVDLLAMKQRAAAIGGSIARLEAALLAGGMGEADAAETGTAWALVGEVRALPHRLGHGRHGLPADRVAALEPGLDRLDPAALAPAFRDLVREICAEAEASLPAARGMPPFFRGYRQLTLHYIKRLRKAGWNPFAVSVNAPTFGRAWSVARIKIGV